MAFECSEVSENDPVARQDILFARIYQNHAWGDQLEGWFIDNAGYVKGFSNQRNQSLDWINSSEGGFITENDLFHNYLQSDTTFMNLTMTELYRYYSKTQEAIKGTLTERESGGADMGQFSYYILEYFPDIKKYKFVIMESNGDFIIRNTSSEAGQIAQWLKRIDKDLAMVDYSEVE